jgi:hypothetical protein
MGYSSILHIVQSVEAEIWSNLKEIATEIILMFFESLICYETLVKNLQKSTRWKFVKISCFEDNRSDKISTVIP